MRRDGADSNGGVIYSKTSGITYATGWVNIATASGASVASPTGAIFAYGGPSAPAGWLICDGSAVSRTTYSLLFAVVGTAYGAGDGSTTFNVPDLRGRTGVGYAVSGGHADVSTLGNGDATALASRRPKHAHGVGTLVAANESSHTHGPGTFSISGGSHVHGLNGLPVYTSAQIPYGMSPGGPTTVPNSPSGSLSMNSATHSHPSGEWAGASAAGSAHTHALSGSVGTTASAPSEAPAYLVVNHIIKT
jgi:microcystin-dependent protein